jgi:hypothetical protein
LRTLIVKAVEYKPTLKKTGLPFMRAIDSFACRFGLLKSKEPQIPSKKKII